MRSSDAKRSAFSLVELLVVMVIIGILIAILLPAVQAARESARRTTCQKNLRQIGLALHNYESVRKKLPIGAKSQLGLGLSWIVELLPYMEEGQLHRQLNLRIANPTTLLLVPENGAAVDNVILAVLRCPSSPTNQTCKVAPTYQVCLPSYVGIAGSINDDQFAERRVTPCCAPTVDGQLSAGGVLIPNQPIKLSGVTDGLSNVLCVGEQSDFAIDISGRQRDISGGYAQGWLSGTSGEGTPPNYFNSSSSLPTSIPVVWNLTTIRYAINTRTYELPGVKDSHGPNNPLTSPHVGGVYGLLLDGSVHFISEQIDLLTLRRQATRDDGISLAGIQ